MPSNLERMIHLAEEFFATKNDPAQISVTPEVMERLRQLHPSTLTELDEGNGPVAWILLIPTTQELMERFIARKISEKELLDKTPLRGRYEAVYLCSALVLPEYRGKGLARRLTCNAVKSLMEDHPIESLFYWGFSSEGEKLASSVARALHLPLHKKPE
jgi:GNAT superfamily N-acetyltransferase